MKHSAPPAPRRKYPPLTAAQQKQVLAYRKIATDFARRLTISYARLITNDEAESIAMLALCQAAQRFDPTRAVSVWPLAKLRIRQRIFEYICGEMRQGKRRTNLDTLVEVIDKAGALRRLRGLRGKNGSVTDLSDRLEALTASDADRDALRGIVEWVGENPTRAETIDRVVAGKDPLTPEDLDRLEALRDELGLPFADVVDVATASLKLGRSPKALRIALAQGTVPGFRCGATWRVYLGAALRCAA